MSAWSVDGGDLLVNIRLTPNAARQAVGGIWTDAKGGEWLGARVSAVPEKGKANVALIALLAKALDCPRSAISLESGATNRLKRLRIKDGDQAAMSARLAAVTGEQAQSS